MGEGFIRPWENSTKWFETGQLMVSDARDARVEDSDGLLSIQSSGLSGAMGPAWSEEQERGFRQKARGFWRATVGQFSSSQILF